MQPVKQEDNISNET